MTLVSPSLRRPSAGLRATQELRRCIQDGVWSPGHRLPSEHELVNRLQVSRGTIRSALKQLQGEGLLHELPGRGRKARGRVVSEQACGGAGATGGIMSKTVVLLADVDELDVAKIRPEWDVAADAAASRAARRLGHHVLTFNGQSLLSDDTDLLLRDPPLGVIAMHKVSQSPYGQDILGRLVSAGISVVAYGNAPGVAGFDRVYSDHEAGAAEITRWLVTQGRRHILHVGFETPVRYWLEARHRGYRNALAEAGLPTPAPVEVSDAFPRSATGWDEAEFRNRTRMMAGFLAEHVLPAGRADALMAHNDLDAAVAAAALRLLGLEPGMDVLVTGYDNWHDVAERRWEPSPPAVTVDKRNDLVGEAMVALLTERVTGGLDADPVARAVPPTLVASAEGLPAAPADGHPGHAAPPAGLVPSGEEKQETQQGETL